MWNRSGLVGESDDDGDAEGRFMTGRFIIVLLGEINDLRPARGGVLLGADRFNIKQSCVTEST